jgi:hypothetical protein
MLLFLGSASIASIDLFGAVLLGGPYLSGVPQLWQAFALVVSWFAACGIGSTFSRQKATTDGKSAPEQPAKEVQS